MNAQRVTFHRDEAWRMSGRPILHSESLICPPQTTLTSFKAELLAVVIGALVRVEGQ